MKLPKSFLWITLAAAAACCVHKYCDADDAPRQVIDVLARYGRGLDYTELTIKKSTYALKTSQNNAILLNPGSWTISKNTIIPKNIALKIASGAVLTIADGVTLSVHGPFLAEANQVFQCEGTGKVVFGDDSIKEILPQWWGVAAGGDPAKNTQALDRVIQTAKTKGLSVFFAKGRYSLRLYVPIRQAKVPVEKVEDFNGIVIRGEGKESIIETANPGGGCDVFQFNGVKNITVKDLGVHSILPTPNPSGAGSNAFSFTGGSSHITVQNVHVYPMPHYEYPAPRHGLDGGSSFSIQNSAPAESTHIRILDCVSEGGTHGLHYCSGDANPDAAPPHDIVFHNNVIKNQFHGLAILNSGGPQGPRLVRRSGMSFSATNNTFIDCQKGMYIAGVTRVNLIGNMVKSNLESPKDDKKYASYDSVKYGISVGTSFDCNIINNVVHERDCDFFMNIYGGAAAQPDTPSENITVIGNVFTGTSRTPECTRDTGRNHHGLFVKDLHLTLNAINGRPAVLCNSFLVPEP